MQSQSISVEQTPFLYITGMNISVASTTVIAIAPGQCRDSNDNIDMVYQFPLSGNSIYAEHHNDGLIPAPVPQYTNAMSYSLPLFVNSAVIGVNGLDQGVLAASSNYLVYAIADSTGKKQPAAILTLQSNAFPLMPLGYDSYRLLGFVSTNSSTAFTQASVLNAAFYKGYFVSPPIAVLTGGNSYHDSSICYCTIGGYIHPICCR
jgi:hypothetical protein